MMITMLSVFFTSQKGPKFLCVRGPQLSLRRPLSLRNDESQELRKRAEEVYRCEECWSMLP